MAHLQLIYLLKVVIFHSYVSLPRVQAPKAVVEICRNESWPPEFSRWSWFCPKNEQADDPQKQASTDTHEHVSTNINPKNGYQPRFHRTNLLPHKKISYRVVASNGAIDIPLLASNPLRPHPHEFLGSPTWVLKTMLADESTWMFGRYHYANAYIFSESPKSKDIILNAITSLWERLSSTIATFLFLQHLLQRTSRVCKPTISWKS